MFSTMAASGATVVKAATVISWYLVTLSILSLPEVSEARSKVRRHNIRSGKMGGFSGIDDGVCELEISCKSDDINPVLPVRLPIRGPRGPPGPKGDRGAPGEGGGTAGLYKNPAVEAAQPTPASSALGLAPTSGPAHAQRKVAFFVGLSENLGPVHENRDVIFDRIVTNIGSAYSAATGRFSAPAKAAYQFNIIISAQGRQKAAVMMVKNGAMVATVWAESIPFWASASNVAVLQLEPGDQVWIQLLSRASYLHGYMYTTFSGFMIFEN